jgi:hypothetical protein
LLPVIVVLAVGCGSGGPDPRTLIPVDSDAWVAVRSAQDISVRVAPIVEQYPEFGGAVDFIRSVVGIDFARPDRESGLDPRRGAAGAWWRGGLLLLLPVSDASLASRRIALRLARFGFVQSPGGGPVRDFESGERGHACFQVYNGIAAVYVGTAETCVLLAGVAATADDSRESAVRKTVETVTDELDMGGADIIFRVGNALMAPELLRAAGLSSRGTAAMVASGMLGDLRGALVVDRTVKVRMAVGAEGGPFRGRMAVPADPGPQAGAVEVDVTVGSGIRPMLDSAVSMCGRRCTSRGIDMMFAAWDGRLKVTVPSVVDSPDGQRPGGPLATLLRVFDKVTVTGVAGMRHSSEEIVGIVRKRVEPPVVAAVPVLPPQQTDAATPAAVPVEAPVESGGPVKFRFEGHDVAVAASKSSLAVAAGPAALASVNRLIANDGASSLPAPADGPLLASVRVNPEGLLNVSGFGFLDYLRHLVNPIRQAGLDIYYEQGRVFADGRIIIR